MPAIVKPYLFKASLFAGLALLLGILLSLAIYISSDQVRENSIDLVEQRIPVLMSINRVIADLSEQERIIDEYYSNQNEALFLQAFERNKKTIFAHSLELAKHPIFAVDLSQIRAQQEQLEIFAGDFHQAMQQTAIDWHLLRSLLVKISKIRRDMLPVLQKIEQKTKLAVDQGHQQALKQMNITHKMVIIYGFSIVFLAGVVSWYIKQYVLTNAKNTRLALFPQLNPNPILSINNLGELVFHNPACVVLLNKIGSVHNDIMQLVPANFDHIRHHLSSTNQHTTIIEQMLNEHILQFNINWLVQLDTYDIYIVDITERKLAEQKVNHLAFYMQETNLPNQYKLTDDVELLTDKKQKFSLGLFEIRNFNRLVTSHGVKSMNELTKVLAQIISIGLPEKSYLYHLNQNQFALLCYDITSEMLLDKLIKDIDSLAEKPIVTDCGEFFIELDFGFALYPNHGENFSGLYKNAHTALNIAAADKYGNSILFKNEFAKAQNVMATMVDNLRNALLKKELFLVFQPQLDLSNNKISGIETLVRWRHQDQIISPAEFIPLAEQSGLIVPIGHWILTQACWFAKEIVTAGYQDVVVAVNVSPRQFSHPDFLNSVIEVLAETQLPAKNLELEITEGLFMHNESDMLLVLNQLKSLGLQLSIDDFGTGYSSLSYLKQFPVDKLKIDQSFIRACHDNSEDKALVKTIVALGKSLGLSLIAEGVEKYEHLTFLQQIDCDEIQGYWFSKPLAADELMNFLAETNKVRAVN